MPKKFGKTDFSETTVIIPTLNEAGSIGELIKRLSKLYYGINIIVCDDGSTDGTAEKVKKIAVSNRRVMFVDHSKAKIKGLTASVVYAAELVATPKIVVMDGDMQHPPELVGKIAHMLDESDLCVGIRTRVNNWSWYRRFLSKGISYFSYFIFKIRRKRTCDDIMSGFFGIKTKLFKRVIAEHKEGFVLRGYKVLLDTLRMLDRSVRISEVPYDTFHPREKGESKLKIRHMVDVLVSTLK